MIYAHGLGLAAIGHAIIRSEATNAGLGRESELVLRPRAAADAERNLESHDAANSDDIAETCTTEAACKEQAKRLDFRDIHYYVSD